MMLFGVMLTHMWCVSDVIMLFSELWCRLCDFDIHLMCFCCHYVFQWTVMSFGVMSTHMWCVVYICQVVHWTVMLIGVMLVVHMMWFCCFATVRVLLAPMWFEMTLTCAVVLLCFCNPSESITELSSIVWCDVDIRCIYYTCSDSEVQIFNAINFGTVLACAVLVQDCRSVTCVVWHDVWIWAMFFLCFKL